MKRAAPAPQGTSGLGAYRAKRDFTRTPEPKGAKRGRKAERLAYVVQKHDARRLHYDLRLEHDGVLKSWAVPKEPTLEPKQRRLAVQTEDHPLEYGSFEGEIPANEYGAGSVLIWDRGYWTPEGDVARGLEEGKLDFELHGERLRGRWTLVRMRRNPRERKDNWLLIKRSDRAAPSADGARGPRPAEIPGARRGALPAAPAPQLATLVKRVPSGREWLHEPKLDGYRLLARLERGRVKLVTRSGKDWTDRFPGIAAAVAALSCRSALLDGEAVVFDAHGRTSFQRLQTAIGAGSPSIVLVAFDLLHLDGWDLREAPLVERKRVLRELLAGAPAALRFGDHVQGGGEAFFREACRAGLEGVVSKRADDPYRAARTKSWLKIKCLARQEAVIVGFTDPAGSRQGLGALLLGVRDHPEGPLRYAGKVGTGFDERTLHELRERLDALERKTAPVEHSLPRHQTRNVHWVRPELVAEVAFGEWTNDGRMRHPVFRGLREDKPAREVVEERPADASDAGPPRAQVKLTHPDKVLFPDVGITKQQLADYWQRVAEWALPHLRDRPLTLYRCPEGYGAHCFYQKRVGVGVPDAVGRVVIEEGKDPYAMVDGLPALLGLVQIGVLELHVWGSRAGHLEQPDIIVFDLDPSEELPWSAVVDAAHGLKERLEALGLHAFARVTGGKGLHVVVPVEPGPDWAAVKRFSRQVVLEMVRDEPKRFTASVSKSRRGGKIFVDYLRNAREATAIAAYSPRAKAGAPVAMPVEWDALDHGAKGPPRFGVLEVPDIVRRRERDPWHAFDASRRPLL
ncbi:MAG TPA: DNA ligase D [Gammaproteobacteria bacterium]